MTILEEIKQGFAAEFEAAVPDAAIELQREGRSGAWQSQRGHMVQKFMDTYGNILVASAVAGLNNERMALMVAQEFATLMTMTIVGGSTAFEAYIKTALTQLFKDAMQDVIRERLEEWHDEAAGDRIAATMEAI